MTTHRKESQITHKSIMKALFCSPTHIKTYFEKKISRGVFPIVCWGCRGCGRGICDQKSKKWPLTGKKSHFTRKSNKKAPFSSRTQTKIYFEENISRVLFHIVYWGCRGCGRGMCDQKGKELPLTGKKLQITQNSNMKALFRSRTHTKVYF